MKGVRLSIARHFQSCNFVLLSIHVVFYCSLRLAPWCLASTLVLLYIRTYRITWQHLTTYHGMCVWLQLEWVLELSWCVAIATLYIWYHNCCCYWTFHCQRIIFQSLIFQSALPGYTVPLLWELSSHSSGYIASCACLLLSNQITQWSVLFE